MTAVTVPRELLPCPFCGNPSPNLTHDDYVHDDGQPMPVVECTNCHTWVRAESWNNRAQQPAAGGEREVPEVVGSLIAGEFYHCEQNGATNCPLMTVAQHERIVAQLQARASLAAKPNQEPAHEHALPQVQQPD